jgi:signal transduction histidine kinase/ligand-binding sensor domain-containing protein
MKGKYFFIILILTLAFSFFGFSQNAEIKFNLVVGNNGEPLGNGNINSITQDKQGYMWFSGQGAGCLFRYDGNRILTFKHDKLNGNSPARSRPETVYADQDGMIWIGYFNGDLDKYDPGTGIFTHYKNNPNDPGSLSAGMVSAVLKDNLGRLWVGTANGLDRLDEKTEKFIHYRNVQGNDSSLSCDFVRGIYEDRAGTLWIGTGFEFFKDSTGGLNRLEANGTFTRFLHDPKNPNSLINNKVRAILEDSRGIFWIGTSGDGLHTMNRSKGIFERHLYDPKNQEKLSRPALKPGETDPITFIQEDSSGAIWIGTYKSGINRYDMLTKKITHYFKSGNGFPDDGCWQAYTSRDGVLWLASTEGNPFLYRVDATVNRINQISTGPFVNCIYESENGSLWLGSSGTGIFQYDQQKKLVRQYKSDLADSIDFSKLIIFSIFQNQPDTLWISTNDGIVLLNLTTNRLEWLRYKSDPNSMPQKFDEVMVTRIIQDKKGIKWFATQKGLMQYNPANGSLKKYQPYPADTVNHKTNTVMDVLEDSTGNIWLATSFFNYSTMDLGKGISRFNRGTGHFSYYLNDIGSYSLFKDSKGVIWAGTEKGLYKYNRASDSFSPFFDAQSSLNDMLVSKIVEDDNKNLWILLNSSFVKINADRTRYFIYGRKFGIKAESLLFGGLAKTSKGEILVGNASGFYAFYPGDLVAENKPLKVVISNLSINNSTIFSGNESPIKSPIEETSKIDLKYNQNNIFFRVSVFDYRAPEANMVYTMLENYDNVWRESVDKSATYINVPPGKYIFHVKAYNIDGVKAEKAFEIIIRPPWWKTGWAYSIYVFMLLVVSFGMNRFLQERAISKERQKAQVKELAQAREIEKAYTELKTTQTQLIQSEKMASLGELTAGIAHEIQNPLNFVNNFSDVNKELLTEMKEEMDKGNMEEAKEIAGNIFENEDKINHHGKRADAIVKGMLQHSRSSTGQKEPADINALADEYFRLSYHGFRAKDKSFNSTLQTDFDESIGKINIIPQDIGRVLLNLYNNAFYAVADKKKQNPEGLAAGASAKEAYEPIVSVSTKKLNKKIEIQIKDNGNGIPLKVKDKIFQPFFTTKPTGEGTGLGLSLSYDMIKAHGGELKVESMEGEGSTFIVKLPVG